MYFYMVISVSSRIKLKQGGLGVNVTIGKYRGYVYVLAMGRG